MIPNPNPRPNPRPVPEPVRRAIAEILGVSPNGPIGRRIVDRVRIG